MEGLLAKLAKAEAALDEAKASAREPAQDYERRVAEAKADVKEVKYQIEKFKVEALLAAKTAAGAAWTGEDELSGAKRNQATAEEAWKRAMAVYEALLLRVGEALPAGSSTPELAIRAYLATLEFPTTTDAYEFPDLALRDENKYAESVRAAGVKLSWASPGEQPKPDFLVTHLERSLVTLEEFTWNKDKRRLSRTGVTPGEQVALSFRQGARSMTCLVAASGTGKTRLLFEKCFAEFGVYLTAKTSPSQPGSTDLSSLLGELPQDAPTGPAIDQLRTRLIEFMNRVLLARALVLLAAKAACPGLQPRHWLALQLYPGRFVKAASGAAVRDVFDAVVRAIAPVPGQAQLLLEWDESGIRFVALDEAQSADARYPNVFPSEDLGPGKRSVLSPLLVALAKLPHVVIAGTGLGIESAYATGISSVAKHGVRPRLLGLTTMLEGDSLTRALRDRGVFDAEGVNVETRKLFAGRPRFAMRLAEALLLGEDPEATAVKFIITDMANVLLPKLRQKPADLPQAPKTVYGEVRFAAQQWTLRGLGAIINLGDAALEAGVCALAVEPSGDSASSSKTAFVVKEPLVLRAFTDLAAAEFEGVTNESNEELGVMLENYVALNAAQVCAALNEANGVPPEYRGPWKLADPGGAQRRGMTCKNGDEPAAIRDIVACAGDVGVSVVFPGTLMGADVVFAARRADGRKLLVFAQVKASFKASAPEALRSLTLPYHANREKTPKLPMEPAAAHSALNNVIGDANTSVVFVVFKFPGNGKAKAVQVMQYDEKNLKKPVLYVLLDGRNAEDVLPGMKRGLEAVREVKKRRF